MVLMGFPAGFALGIILSLLYIGIRCFFKVEQGYVAVLTAFGKAEFRDESRHLLIVYRPGLHFKFPWQEKIEVSVMEQVLDLSGESGGTTAMAEDGTILRLDSKLRFITVEEELYDYLFVLRNQVEHIKGLFTCLLRNEIANFKSNEAGDSTSLQLTSGIQPGSYALIRRERRLLNLKIEDFCQRQMSGRYGVRFEAVDLSDILPPDEIGQALNAVFNAQAETDTRYARAEAEAQQRVLSAERGVAIAKARSQAAETEILTLAKFLSELHQNNTLNMYIERRRAEVLAESRAVFVRRSS